MPGMLLCTTGWFACFFLSTLSIAEQSEPRERMVQVVRWYLSAFHAGRKGSVAKKPYNPILGEVFYCHWDLPAETDEPVSGVSVRGYEIYIICIKTWHPKKTCLFKKKKNT